MSSNHFVTKKILLVRHGRTDWNDVQKFQGRTDVPLNETGLAQAETVARRIEGWPADAVYTSPLMRARQTAGIIAERQRITPIVTDDLTEINFGAWEGLNFKKLLDAKDNSLLKWIADPFFCMPDGAEDWDAVKSRSERVVNAVLASGHKHVVIVSHGGIMRALLVVLLGFDPHTVWKIKSSNCSLTGIEVREHETSLVFANDVLHFKETRTGVPLSLW